MVSVIEASGKLWLTNAAPYSIVPYAARTAFAYVMRCD